ncbi:MAG: hypothetical protein OEY81_00130 [Candidatus Bathyarchaeota archaeon]|nr:hypothetical protein [Candidatus Bathyarchaeota archaeon]
MRFIGFLSFLEYRIAANRKYSFSFIALFALIGMWLNFNIGSYQIGGILFLMYSIPNIVFIGKILFGEDRLGFRVFYGSILFIGLTSIVGSLTYFIHDLSPFTMTFALAGLTLVTSFFNGRVNHVENKNQLHRNDCCQTQSHMIFDVFYLFLVFLCFFSLTIVRTGESLRSPWDIVPPQFFVSFFLAVSSLLIIILFKTRKPKILLVYVVLLIFIPTSIYLLVLKHPAEFGVWSHVAWERHFAEFGRFVSNPSQIEHASSPIHKQIEYIGHYSLVVIFSRLLQVDPIWINLFLTPFLYSIYVPASVYSLFTFMKPQAKKLALVASVALVFSQHNIFLVVPPDNPETLAFAFLFLAILFWIKYIRSRKMGPKDFLVPTFLTIATCLIHVFVGVSALIVMVLSIYLSKIKPLGSQHKYHIRSGKGAAGFFVLAALASTSLLFVYSLASLIRGNVFGYSGYLSIDFDIAGWIELVFHPLWYDATIPLNLQLFYCYLNNFSYVLYIFILLGIFGSLKKKLDLEWVFITLSLLVFYIVSMIIHRYFFIFPKIWEYDYYRFFYPLNFVSFPLVGVGIYQLKEWVQGASRKIRISIGKFHLSLSKHLSSVFLVLILSGCITASLYGGFPRETGEVLVYKGKMLKYVSDYDFEAVRSIKEVANDHDFFIFGDIYTGCAVLSEFGFKTIDTENGSLPIFSSIHYPTFWELWGDLITDPSFFPLERVTELTGVKEVYVVLTYRLEQDRLEWLSDIYPLYLGKPIFEVARKIYVFKWQSVNHLIEGKSFGSADDDQASSDFWPTGRYGKGNIDVSLSDDYIAKAEVELFTKDRDHKWNL